MMSIGGDIHVGYVWAVIYSMGYNKRWGNIFYLMFR